MAPPTTSRISRDGVELSVTTWGQPGAPVVVLVHGFPDTHAVWIPVAELLHADGFRVVAADVRGAGASDAPDGVESYRLEELVADLLAVIDAVSPTQPVHLVGHDWGSIQSWEAVAAPTFASRVASYTSISGLPLDHASRWVRAEVRRARVLTLARQAGRSSYVGVFHLPGVAALARRGHRIVQRSRGRWAATLQRIDGARTDAQWPAPSFGRDVGQGMALYRANFRGSLRHRRPARPTTVPVQLVLPLRDRFVPAWLFEGIEEVAPNLERVELDAGHWVVRSHPAEVAHLIADHARAHPAAGNAARSVRGAGGTAGRRAMLGR
jgi:pimeloyl-ACP methyl ester carboxylesterase